MTANIKCFDSARHAGLTAASIVAGNLIAFLDSALVNGANLQTLQSIAVSGGIATVICNNHGFMPDMWVLFANANEAVFNSEFQVLSAPDLNTFTFAITGAPATATGTITVKQAPLGWEKPFSGTNLAAYRSLNATSKKNYLVIDDTTTFGAAVWGAEAMTSITAGTGIWPGTPTVFTKTTSWCKGTTAGAGVSRYVLVGDDKRFFLFTFSNSGLFVYNLYYFGDFASVNPAEIGNVYLLAESSISPLTSAITYANSYSQGNCAILPSATYAGYTSRTGGGVLFGRAYHCSVALAASNVFSGSNQTFGANDLAAVANAVGLSPMTIIEYTTGYIAMRGYLKGIFYPLHRTVFSFAAMAVMPVSLPSGMRKAMYVPCAQGSNTSVGGVFIDMTGPWE